MMKISLKPLLAAFVAVIGVGSCGLASAASVDLMPNNLEHKHLLLLEDMSTVELDTNDVGSASVLGTYYSNMGAGGGYFAAAPANGVVGLDDYDGSPLPGGASLIKLTQFKFVGGVTSAGGIAFFDFFDTSSAFVDGFGIAFTSPGNFIYTITIGSGVHVPDAGFVQMTVDSGTTGQWFLSDAAPTIGTTADNPPGATGPAGQVLNHKFEITGIVPEPSSVVLLLTACAGLLAFRRR